MPPLATARASNAAWKPAYTPVGIFVGGTSGIGQGIAEAFARHTNGTAHIILVGRNRAAALAILARLPPPTPDLTREFVHCDLSLIANAKHTSAQLAARFPRVHLLVLSAGAISLAGLDVTEEGVDKQMAALYYSKYAWIAELLPSLRAAQESGEGARVAAVHTAGRGGPIDLADLGLKAGIGGGLGSVRKLLPQLSSYQDLMAESFALRAPSITFMHTHPGTVDTPLLRASPSAVLRAAHRVRFLLFPTLWWRAKSIEQCGEQQLCGILRAPPGASRIDGEGDDIGLGGDADPGWAEARAALWAHSEEIVGGVRVQV